MITLQFNASISVQNNSSLFIPYVFCVFLSLLVPGLLAFYYYSYQQRSLFEYTILFVSGMLITIGIILVLIFVPNFSQVTKTLNKQRKYQSTLVADGGDSHYALGNT